MPLPPVSEKKFTEGYPSLKICVTGAGGFIASHLARRLKAEGHFVRAVDWKENEYMKESDFCDEFMNLDLRNLDNCRKAVEGMEWCFNLAVRLRLCLSVCSSPAEGLLGRHSHKRVCTCQKTASWIVYMWQVCVIARVRQQCCCACSQCVRVVAHACECQQLAFRQLSKPMSTLMLCALVSLALMHTCVCR